MQKYVLTTNLSPQLYEWLDSQAKARKETKRAVLEDALEQLRVAKLRAEMRESMIRASKDPEIMAMAEWGMQDVAEQLNKIDGGYPND